MASKLNSDYHCTFFKATTTLFITKLFNFAFYILSPLIVNSIANSGYDKVLRDISQCIIFSNLSVC
jgi:hypothetical protein